MIEEVDGMKKISIIALLIILVLTGCSSGSSNTTSKEENVMFNEYLDSLITESIYPSQIDINYMFEKPEDFGIEPAPYELGFTTKEDYAENVIWSKKQIDKLTSFKDSDLTFQQQINRDVLIYQLETTVLGEDFYDYEIGSSYLGYSRSTSINLPATLDVYTFREERDILYYLHFLETLDGYVQQYVDLEIERQERGTGYGQEEIDELIKLSNETYEAALKEDYYLIQSFNKRIDELDFLTNEEKEGFKSINADLTHSNFANSYKMIVDGLQDIEAPSSTGFANKPDGEKYFQYALRKNTGKDINIDELEDYVVNRFNSIIRELQMMPDLFEEYVNLSYGEYSDGYELLDSVYKDMEGVFPPAGDIKYKINTVDESMSAGSSPAFYFTPAVDYTFNEDQYIFINGDFDVDNYLTYTHEGLPGHMYQFSYFITLNNHPIRRLYTDSGNAEGWAKYAERQALYFVAEDKLAQYADYYTQLNELIYIQMELGVHYLGWSFEEFKSYMSSNFNLEDRDIEQELLDTYLYTVHSPAVNSTYYLSSQYFEEEKNVMKKAIGEKYTDLMYHEWVLSLESAPMDVVSQYMKRYIENGGMFE